MTRIASLFVALLMTVLLGCASHHEEGVKSDMISQWTTVEANTKATTDAAKTVLERRQLKDITSDSTALDGWAKAKMADGTKVSIEVKHKSDAVSEVEVSVGTMGDAKLGAEIAKQIKMQAEGK